MSEEGRLGLTRASVWRPVGGEEDDGTKVIVGWDGEVKVRTCAQQTRVRLMPAGQTEMSMWTSRVNSKGAHCGTIVDH